MSNNAQKLGAFLPKLMGGILRAGRDAAVSFAEQAKIEVSEKAMLEAKKLQLTTIILQNPDTTTEVNKLANQALEAIEQRICIIEAKKLSKEVNAKALVQDVLKGI